MKDVTTKDGGDNSAWGFFSVSPSAMLSSNASFSPSKKGLFLGFFRTCRHVLDEEQLAFDLNIADGETEKKPHAELSTPSFVVTSSCAILATVRETLPKH